MFKIVRWERYEVDSRGDAWIEGAALRKGPLQYLRVTCNGAAWGLSYRRLLSTGGDDAAAAFGLYIKLLELSGAQPAPLRGTVRNPQGEAATPEEIAESTGFPLSVVTRGLAILKTAGWITETPGNPENSGKLPEFREITANQSINQSKQSNKISSAKSFAGDPVQPQTHGESEGKDPDPLAPFLGLVEFYPHLLELIREAHPKARLPKAGSGADFEARATLAKLVRIDGYKPNEIVAALEWVFESDHRDAQFWRAQVAAIPPLRKAGSSGLTKFGAIHERWLKATGGNGHDKSDPNDFYSRFSPADIQEFEAEYQAEMANANGGAQ
ncbi:MAG TPA: hypothetical protein P5318_18790 [Candidatus Hydrogenedentes bacterium]|nr:hypothetical protein [Candidatus Hydrogenedentota bacterium]HPC16860.1 hypothetical protein [Candidatus Hydrogenedentota bacterium]HPC16867.1 hypothetical protein [Candidatus Hydrogenedentota bacterium]HRT22155.1 hypothetical protein [Candidatus Hydrogenedentota bacterium]HRT22162.1 hypothetical protein [Candidatus Hydrogenedentota bacterium]